MWGALVVGVSAVHAGHLNGVLLAGLALIPLVAFELVAGLPARNPDAPARAPLGRTGVRGDGHAGAGRRARASRSRFRRRRIRCACAACAPDIRARERWALAGVDLDLEPGQARGRRGPERRRQVDARGGAAAVPRLRAGLGHARRRGDRRSRRRCSAGGSSGWSPRTPTCSTARSRRTCGWPDARRATDQLRAALAAVRLLDWAEGLPEGLGTEVGERGRADVGRPTPAPGDRQGPARRLSRARPRRARRAPGHADRGCDRRRPAGDHAREGDSADHPPARRAAGGRRGAGARSRPGDRARHATPSSSPAAGAMRRCGSGRTARPPSGRLCALHEPREVFLARFDAGPHRDEPSRDLVHRDRALVPGLARRTRSAT